MSDRVITIPVRNPQLFSPVINREVLIQGNLYELLSSAVRALPHVSDPECRENLKQALCDILMHDQAA